MCCSSVTQGSMGAAATLLLLQQQQDLPWEWAAALSPPALTRGPALHLPPSQTPPTHPPTHPPTSFSSPSA